MMKKQIVICSFWFCNQNDWRSVIAATDYAHLFAYQNIFVKHKVLSSGRPMSAPTYAKMVGLNKPTVNILQLLN
jgi:hypothetical protein